jgi:hypothetical protein
MLELKLTLDVKLVIAEIIVLISFIIFIVILLDLSLQF